MKIMPTLISMIPTKPGQGVSSTPKNPGTKTHALVLKTKPQPSITAKGSKATGAQRAISRAPGTAKKSKISKMAKTPMKSQDVSIHAGVTPMPAGTSNLSAGGKMAAMLTSSSAPSLAALMDKKRK